MKFPSYGRNGSRLAGLVVTIGLLAACGGSPAGNWSAGGGTQAAAKAGQFPPALQAIVDGARKEGQLTLVWGEGAAGGSEGAKLLAEGLNKRYGLNLDIQYTPGPAMPDMGVKILQEFQAGRPASSDIMIGSETHFPPLITAKALEPVDWASWAPNVKDPALIATPDGTAVKIASRTPGITYNTSKVKPEAAPKTMQDVLKPEFKGRVASTPYGAMFDRLGSDEWWGETKAVDYVTKLSAQAGGLIRCGEVERLASGEFDMFALDCGAGDELRGKAKGATLAQAVPTDAAALVYWYMGIPKNAAHPNAAKLFIDHLMSREGQDVMWNTSFEDEYSVPGAHSAGPISQLKAQGVMFKEIDINFIQRNDETRTDRLRKQLQGILAKK